MESNFDGLPPKEPAKSPKKWRSSYNPVALRTLEKINKTGETQEHPGVRFSHSLVDVNKVAGLVHSRQSNQEQEKGQRSKLIYVIFTGYQSPPGGDPDDEIHAVYDRVLTVLP